MLFLPKHVFEIPYIRSLTCLHHHQLALRKICLQGNKISISDTKFLAAWAEEVFWDCKRSSVYITPVYGFAYHGLPFSSMNYWYTKPKDHPDADIENNTRQSTKSKFVYRMSQRAQTQRLTIILIYVHHFTEQGSIWRNGDCLITKTCLLHILKMKQNQYCGSYHNCIIFPWCRILHWFIGNAKTM